MYGSKYPNSGSLNWEAAVSAQLELRIRLWLGPHYLYGWLFAKYTYLHLLTNSSTMYCKGLFTHTLRRKYAYTSRLDDAIQADIYFNLLSKKYRLISPGATHLLLSHALELMDSKWCRTLPENVGVLHKV